MVYEKHISTEKEKNYEIKWNFVGNKTNYAVCLKNAVNFLVASIFQWISKGVFLHAVICIWMYVV